MSINSVGSHKGDSGDYVTEARRKGREITIVVTARRKGRYEAHLGERVLCTSKKPFFDAARRLIALGFDPGIALVMRHAGSETECLRSTIGAAAALTVEDTKYGPEFRPWKPLSTLAVSRRIASPPMPATTLAAGVNYSNKEAHP
jgi:hypothetical protein